MILEQKQVSKGKHNIKLSNLITYSRFHLQHLSSKLLLGSFTFQARIHDQINSQKLNKSSTKAQQKLTYPVLTEAVLLNTMVVAIAIQEVVNR